MPVPHAARLVLMAVMPPLLLLTNILFFTFYPDHYHRLWARHDVPAATDLGQAELDQALTVTLAYLRGQADQDDLVLEREGSVEPLYGARATAHLVDVRRLYQQAFAWRLGLAVTAGLALVAGLLQAGRRHLWLGETLRLAAWVSLAAAAVVVLPFLLDFARFWDIFHEIFFDNDLWRLEYDERMIQLFPNAFFLETILWIGGTWLAQVGAMLLVGTRLKAGAWSRAR